jgi:hypothetical protein
LFGGRLAARFIRVGVDHAFVIPWAGPRFCRASAMSLDAAFYSRAACGFFPAKCSFIKMQAHRKDAPDT